MGGTATQRDVNWGGMGGQTAPGAGKPAEKGFAEGMKTKTRANQDSVPEEMEGEEEEGQEWGIEGGCVVGERWRLMV